MAVNRVPVLKRCRSLGLEPMYLGIDKKSNRELKSQQKNERVRSPVKGEAESEIYLRCVRKALQKLLYKG